MNALIAILKWFMPAVTVDKAISNIVKSIKALDTVIKDAVRAMDKAVAKIDAARGELGSAEDAKLRAAGIKSKLTALVE
jgi:hypothetical protein